MKKVVSILLVCVLLVGCVFAFASCAKTLNGEYKADAVIASATYKFEGNKVAITYEIFGFEKTVEGTYTIAKDEEGVEKITITLNSEDKDEDGADKYEGSFKFVEGKEGDVEYIKIGENDTQFYKVKE